MNSQASPSSCLPCNTRRVYPACRVTFGSSGYPRRDTVTHALHTPAKPTAQLSRTDAFLSAGRRVTEVAGVTVLVSAVSTMLLAQPSHATETLTGPTLDVFTQFLDYIESLGPWGCVIFVITVMLCEMVPLLPTTPLSLSGGLLFGAEKGALLVLLGAMLAAINAFSLSRGVGGSLVQKVVDAEMGEGGEKGGAGAKLTEVQAVIESGGFWSQFWSIALLRLTPVVPFSASNYILGLTPVKPGAFVLGTLLGSGVWSTVYASLGSASRGLFKEGDTEILFRDLAEKSAAYSQTAGIAALAAGLVAAVYFGRNALLRRGREAGSLSSNAGDATGSSTTSSDSTISSTGSGGTTTSSSVGGGTASKSSSLGSTKSLKGISGGKEPHTRRWLDTLVFLRKLRQQPENR